MGQTVIVLLAGGFIPGKADVIDKLYKIKHVRKTLPSYGFLLAETARRFGVSTSAAVCMLERNE
jgi:hypothetical protein